MHSRRILLALFALAPAARANDPRNQVGTGAPSTADLLIDVPRGVFFGVPIGTTKEALYARSGKPTGYLRLNARESVAIYGKAVAFLFENGKVVGLRISDTLIDWELSKSLNASTPFDGVRWRLDNGLRYGTSLVEARRILGSRLQGERFQAQYVEGQLRVVLQFIGYSSQPTDEASYKLGGLFIRVDK
jgi:hypothetical protein